LTCFIRLVASMLECFSIQSVYFWLNLLILSLIYSTLRSYIEYHWWYIKKYNDSEIFVIFLCLSWRLCPTVGRHKPRLVQVLSSRTAIYFRSTVWICCQYILRSWISSCLHLVDMCLLQFSLRSKYSPNYFASLAFSSHLKLLVSVSMRVNVICTDFSPLNLIPNLFSHLWI